MIEISKYVHITKKNDKRLLYNTVNESILLIDENKIKDNLFFINCTSEEIETLKDMQFISDNHKSLNELIEERNRHGDTLIITISITQMCNLACVYCSQNDSKISGVIDHTTLDDIVEYATNVFHSKGYKFIAIDFFGGEPLIGKERILYFKSELEKKISSAHISYAIDTNGILLDRDFLCRFDQLYVNLSLTGKSNHDKLRVFPNNEGTYDAILANLSQCADLFDQEKRQIRIRYNVAENTDELENFVHEIKKTICNLEYIEIAQIINHSFNEYQTTTSTNDFRQWYTDKCIDILLANDMLVDFPSPMYSFCRAYSPYNIKVNFDGGLTLCSAMNFNERKHNIKEIKNKIDHLEDFFQEKRVTPVDHECLECKNIFICGGKQFCKKGDYCDFLNYDLDKYLLKYLEYINSEKIRYFATSKG